MFRYIILSEIGKKNRKDEKLPLSAIGRKILLNYDLLRPLFCPTKKYNSIHVQSYIVSHKKTAHWPKTTTNIHTAFMSIIYLILQNWSHFLSEKCKSKQNKKQQRRYYFYDTGIVVFSLKC